MIARLLPLLVLATLLPPLAGAASAEASSPTCEPGQFLTIGVFPRRNPVTTDRMFSPLAAYLRERLGCDVRLVTAKDFNLFWSGVETGRYDLVHYNQFHYVRSSDDYRVILHNEEFGSGLISGAIYIRGDSGRTDLASLRGKKIAFGGGPDAMMSHIVPRYLLLEAGLQPTDYESAYALNPPNAVLSVYYGKADAAGGGDVVGRLPTVTRLVKPGELRIVARSEPLHHLPWAVRRGLPAPLASAIQEVMLALNDDPRGAAVLKSAGLTGLTAAVDEDFDDCRTIIARVEAAVPLD